MKNYFQDLFDYNHHSNTEVMHLISTKKACYSEKASVLLSHTLNAHHIWNSRIIEKASKYSVWQIHDLKEAFILDRDNFEASKAILEVEKLQKEINYVNSKGNSFQSKIQDILFHIINHSTYHRGQLMGELKQQGFPPIGTDYIFYKR